MSLDLLKKQSTSLFMNDVSSQRNTDLILWGCLYNTNSMITGPKMI